MLKNIGLYIFAILIVLFLSIEQAHSAVRYNPYTGFWEGNICMNSLGWAFVPWQPIGSLCMFQHPSGRVYQGVIINQ